MLYTLWTDKTTKWKHNMLGGGNNIISILLSLVYICMRVCVGVCVCVNTISPKILQKYEVGAVDE